MRIHSLIFRGVGPYRDEQVIDFNGLGASGLYLINGPTGAGKSTIIDCITFALYGKLANPEADDSRLRSDFCGPTDPTEVNMLFETSAGTFRVVRRPTYQRAKARGSGTTTQSAECHLFRVDGATEEAVAETKGAADRELQAIIGLTREQFVQTVVLPQGQFATFLYSDTSRREDVLKRIFDTRLFETVADILAADATEARQLSAAATTAVQQRIGELAAVVTLDDEVRSELDRYAADSLDDALSSTLTELLPAFGAARDSTAQVATDAGAELAAADAQRALAANEAQAKVAVERALAEHEKAVQSVELARTALADHSGIASALTVLIEDDEVADTWRARATQTSTAAGELRALIADEQALAQWPEQEAADRRDIEQRRQQQQEDLRREGELPELIAEQEKVIAARPTADEGSQVEQRAAQLDSITATFRELDELQARESTLSEAVQQALELWQERDADYVTKSQAYRDGIAATLAVDLSDGQPCPVCGSIDHPEIAVAAANQVDASTVEECRAAAADAQVALEGARTRLDDMRQRRDHLMSTAAMTREDLADRKAALDSDRHSLQDRSLSADEADKAVTALRRDADEVSKRIATAEADIAAREAALRTKSEELAGKATVVAEARGDFGSVADRQQAVQRFSGALGMVADRLTELASTDMALQKARTALSELAQREGFADVSAAQVSWEAAQTAHLEADAQARSAHQRYEQLQAGIKDVQDLCAKRAEQIAGSRDVLHLADLFSAGRGSDIGLHIYVLQSLFANVMEAANRRFEGLLNGRYRLALDPGYSGDGRRLQGLGVLVEDRLTGISRSAKTLSGGETFCASLALALGLSDVVRMMAGGVQIDSLFIDEGFGSLDNDQLDEVMEMLGQLSSGGRRVGLISHVDTMKTTITEQIDITPASSGSPAHLTVTWMT